MNHFITKFWFGLFVAIIFLLAAGSLASAQTPPPERDTILLNGFLSCGSNADASRFCPFKLHYVNLTQGRTYLIRMESSDFGANLLIEDMHGKMLANNDEAYVMLNGDIVFHAPRTDSYRFIASNTRPVEGFYTITIREMPAVLNVEAALTASDAAEDDVFVRTFDVNLRAGRRYVIDMESDQFDAFVKLLNREGTIVSFADECDAMRNTRIVYVPLENETYRIAATSYAAGATGVFRLRVCED